MGALAADQMALQMGAAAINQQSQTVSMMADTMNKNTEGAMNAVSGTNKAGTDAVKSAFQ
jgi:hypothetical protein